MRRRLLRCGQTRTGTKRNLAFEEWWPQDDGNGDGNVAPQPQWGSRMEVLGNYEVSKGDMVHAGSLPTATGTP